MATGDIGSIVSSWNHSGSSVSGDSLMSVLQIKNNIYVAVFARNWEQSLTMLTFSVNESTGAISVIDGPDDINPLGVGGYTEGYQQPSIFHITGTIYSICYGWRDGTNYIYASTINIADNGIIESVIANQSLASGYLVVSRIALTQNLTGFYGCIGVRNGSNNPGCLLFSCNAAGTSISLLDIYLDSSVSGNFHYDLKILSSNKVVFCTSYSSGETAIVRTLLLGSSISLIDSEVISGVGSGNLHICQIDGSLWAGSYTYNSLCYLFTFTIDSSGNISSVINTKDIETSDVITAVGSAYNCSDSIIFLFGYKSGSSTLITYSVASNGTIGNLVDSAGLSVIGYSCSDLVKVNNSFSLLSYMVTVSQARLGSLSIETLPDFTGLILELAFNQSIFTESPIWTDVTSELMALNTKRGRMHELSRIEAGTATFILNNYGGNWWRLNSSGDYYALNSGSQNVKPLTLTRLRKFYNSIEYPIWYGVTESFKPNWLDLAGFGPVMELSCVDLFKSFARFNINSLPGDVISGVSTPAVTGLASHASTGSNSIYVNSLQNLFTGQSLKIADGSTSETMYITSMVTSTNQLIFTTNLNNTYNSYINGGYIKKFPYCLSGRRVWDVLFELGWPVSLSDIDAGQVYVIEHEPPTGGTNAMEHLQDIAESEDGLIFISPEGHVTYQDSIARQSSPYNTSQFTFKDDGSTSTSRFVKPEISDDDTFIYNEADISGPGINEQIYRDTVYQSEQGERVLVRKESQIYHDRDAFSQVFTLVERYKDSKTRVQNLLIYPDASPADLYPKVLGYDISDRITLQINSTKNPANLDQAYHIEGIEHEWDAKVNRWEAKWQLWDINQYRNFLLSHAGYVLNISAVSYNSCHDAAVGTAATNDGLTTRIGQLQSAGDYTIYRGYLEFERTATTAALNGAVIVYTLGGQNVDTPFDLTLVSAGTSDNPLTTADYGEIGTGTTSYGSVTISPPITEGQFYNIDLNTTGMDYVNSVSTTIKFGVRSSLDIAGTSPSPPPVSLDRQWCSLMTDLDDDRMPRIFLRLG
jgi:hypothetical protein